MYSLGNPLNGRTDREPSCKSHVVVKSNIVAQKDWGKSVCRALSQRSELGEAAYSRYREVSPEIIGSVCHKPY